MTSNAYIHVRDITTPGICNVSGTYFMCIALLKTLRVLLHFVLFFLYIRFSSYSRKGVQVTRVGCGTSEIVAYHKCSKYTCVIT